MKSIFAVTAFVVQLAATSPVAATAFNLEVTSPYFYRDTYISCAEDHVGAAINLMAISAAPDPNFSFVPSANDSSVGMLKYELDGEDALIGLEVQASSNDSSLFYFATNIPPAVDFKFGPDGELSVADDGNGWLVACNTSAFYYPIEFAINYFNGTGEPDYTQCLNISIARV